MRELAAAQRLFGAALADVTRADDATQLFTGDPERVRGRLAVYRGNVVANAGKALAAAYPVIAQLVGDEFFDGLARAYQHAHPSASGDLNAYGALFAQFLAGFPHARDLPYLPDVARLEWLAHRSHYAADQAAFDVSRLGRISESEYPQLRLTLHPAVALLASPYPIGRVWEVHQPDYAGEIAVDLDSGPQHVLLYRPRFRVAVAVLAVGAAAFLSAVAEGERLGPALERAVAADPEFILAVNLQHWIATRVVVDLTPDR